MSLIIDALRRAQKEGRASNSSPHERLFSLSQMPPLLSHRRRWIASLVLIGVGLIGGVGLALSLSGRGGIRNLFVEATSSMNAREVSSFLLGIFVLVALEGVIFCLLLLMSNRHWMRHQQKFLHEFFRVMHDLEQRNQKVQQDLFFVLRSNLDFQRDPSRDPRARAGSEEGSVGARCEESKVRGKGQELSPDEIQLLVTLSTGGSKSLAKSHVGESSENLEYRLRSLRDKGLIFYSDYSDRVAVLPKAHSYL
ncbi:MAG: hypothetical protein HY694_07880 [Deltaproteobacteria bacterium]|nr:hypothetical protein [Deltaproteobacteria bacterium]